MCGIAGFWGSASRAADANERLQRMTLSLRHRGPDGAAWLQESEVGLGHTRLAIIDLDGGQQPMWDAEERSVLVFNGEIYNYRELREELQALGHRFRTQSDTEVIPAAIRAWGIEKGLNRLRGMFAFALYDVETRELLLARDRVGIKPLFWARAGEGLLFGSEPKALLASGLLKRRVSPSSIHDYLAFGYAVTPATCWEEIHQLEPGSWLRISPLGVRQGRYWNWLPRVGPRCDREGAIADARTTLRGALDSHLVSDVPIGAFLSGGLDSSLIVALLSDGLASGFRTFNMGFDERSYDESSVARQIAASYGTMHHEAQIDVEDDRVELFGKILEQFDEPFGDSSAIPTYLLCREIRPHVKVVLSGDGGDEVLCGYPRYHLVHQLSTLSNLRHLEALFGPLSRFLAHHLGRRGHRIEKAWRLSRLPRAEMLGALHTYFSESERSRLYRPEFAEMATADGPTSARFERLVPGEVDNPLEQLIAAEMSLRLHADYLRKVDVASSAHGLEVRVPFLDNEMLELAARIPTSLKIGRRGETKLIARALAAELLPPGVAARPKQGFDLPLDRWAGGPLRIHLKELLLGSSTRLKDWFREEALESIWRGFDENGGPSSLSRFQRYQRVFLLASLELWLERHNPSIG